MFPLARVDQTVGRLERDLDRFFHDDVLARARHHYTDVSVVAARDADADDVDFGASQQRIDRERLDVEVGRQALGSFGGLICDRDQARAIQAGDRPGMKRSDHAGADNAEAVSALHHTLIVAGLKHSPISAFGDEIAPDLEDQIRALQANDVNAIEFRSAWGTNVVDLSADELANARRELREAQIAVSAIGSPVGKAPIDGDFDSELARLRAALNAAHVLDTRLVRIFSFFIPNGRHQEYRTEVMRRIAVFAKEAERAGVRLVHENESNIYGDDAERCRDVVESVASPALKIAFDPANFVQVGVHPYDEAWPLLAEHVAHFHVKDAVAVDRSGVAPYPAPAPEAQLMASVRPAGQGEAQLPELLRALDMLKYRGFLVIEPHLRFRLQDLDGGERFGVALAALRRLIAEAATR